MAKLPEFKKGNKAPFGPLLVTIRKSGTVWEIEPTDNAQKGILRGRVEMDLVAAKSHKAESIDDEWARRGGVGQPPFRNNPPDHLPILVREGEDVEFKCDQPFQFAVYMGRDQNVNLESKPSLGKGPDDPFEWGSWHLAIPNASIVAMVAQPKLVNGVLDGPADQRFYKVRALVFDTWPPTPVDPDGICDR